MGIQFLAVILLFLFLGKWLDSRLGTAPWLLIVGVFCGAGASGASTSATSQVAQRVNPGRYSSRQTGQNMAGAPRNNA